MQPLPFNELINAGAMSAAPNPKPTASDKRGYGSLASLYTAFSSEFADFALEYCINEGHRRILDPFAGMGTVGETGRRFPIQLLLNDLNPFASLSCLFRTTPADAIYMSIDRVKSLTLSGAPIQEWDAFKNFVESRIGDVATVAQIVNSGDFDRAPNELLDIHLVALIRIATHKRLQGSNPTWTKRSTDHLIDLASFEEARDSVLAAASNYAAKLQTRDDTFSATVRCGDISSLAIAEGSIDAIVTSPPYPNRTDYIRHYLPAAELLIGRELDAERKIRATQIGTPLIRDSLPEMDLPLSVEALIERVRTHNSYASESYYAKGFVFYFADMRRTFASIHRWLRKGGQAIVVVQDTYYKEMRIPVGDLLVDIAAMEGLSVEARKDFPVRQALSHLSAKARQAAPVRTAVESALMLRRR